MPADAADMIRNELTGAFAWQDEHCDEAWLYEPSL